MEPVGFPYNYSLREHLRRRRVEEIPEFARLAHWAEDLPGWRKGLTQGLREMIGTADESPPAPEVRLLDQVERPDFSISRLALQVERDLAVPAYLLSPQIAAAGPPAVLCLARPAAGKSALVGELAPPHQSRPQGIAVELGRQGLLVLVPDLPGCGERGEEVTSLHHTLLAHGDSLVAWQVREALQMLAYLHAQPEIPPGQIGILGTGEGLLVGLLAAILEPAVKAVALHGDLSSFGARLVRSNCLQRPDGWSSEHFLPGLAGLADLADLAALVAPRPLLLVAEADDSADQEHTVNLVKDLYAGQGQAARCEVHLAGSTASDFARLAAEFMVTWLPAGLTDLPTVGDIVE